MEKMINNYYGKKSTSAGDMQQILDIFKKDNAEDELESNIAESELKKSDSLSFLKDENVRFEGIFDNPYWNLNENGKNIPPLNFSNGKTQEDVVKEITELIKLGNKVILLHGVCGSGKSAIALNIARTLGKSSIVVPVKALQRQYEEDYTSKKYLIKKNSHKMKIAMLTGRDNHDSIIFPGSSCADPLLPENIKLTEKNYKKLLEYYEQNPLIQNKGNPNWKEMRRISIAPSNPYWSPIIPADIELNQIKDAKKIRYKGCDGKDYIFYHRKKGCSYYDQYMAYTESDIIIYNAAKFKSEISIGRKPYTEIDIIDEADEFLDSLYQQEELNLTRVAGALGNILCYNDKANDARKKIIEYIELEEKNKRLLGIDESKIFHISETKLKDIFRVFAGNPDLESDILIDEMNYSNKALEAAISFKESMEEVYCTFSKDDENNIFVKLVSTNLSAKFNEILQKSNFLVLMSGTLHSESVLRNIFGIKDYKIVEAENLNLGSIEVIRTGKEFDCKYANFSSKRYTRRLYLESLSKSLDKAILPALVHVHAYHDLPNDGEKFDLDLHNLITSDKLIQLQQGDKTGLSISLFKQGLSDKLFTTKCSRGVDFPGKICNSIIFTKFPNPNVNDTFWKVLQKNHPEHFWDFYKDKAQREFLQRIFRALRSRNDHVFILSPDSRVLDAVRVLQDKMKS